jgi:hypothetical protein
MLTRRHGAVVLLGFMAALMLPMPNAMAKTGGTGTLRVAGPCQDACMEKWERDNARCRRLPKSVRKACWIAANLKLANCLAKCKDPWGTGK